MGKDLTMKKSNFLNGAFIVTLGIVITKILGILYVIPFHAVIGERGGALYGYAYSVYLVFMSLSSLGIPMAISRLISEYQSLGYHNAKKRAFGIGKKLALTLGFFSFLVLFLLAPFFAKLILGDLSGGNTIGDVTLVIRVISLAILVVPILSIYRGYFEGHRFMRPTSSSQVVEQLVRVLIIIIGSFVALSLFKLPLVYAVAVAVFGAFLGALASYLYLFVKLHRNKRRFNERIRSVNEPIITDGQIMKKIVIYALPFIMIDFFKSFYSYIDSVTVIKGLVKYAYFNVSDAENIMSILSTWGNKFNMIVLSISTGIIVSLIPNLSKSIVSGDKKEFNKKINQSFSLLLFLTIPMTMGISFLANPIWTLFYGFSKFGPNVLAYFIFSGLMVGIFTLIISIMQSFKDRKVIFVSLVVGVLLKSFLNTNLVSAFYKMGAPAYYGVITANIIGYLSSIIICLVVLYKKYNINYEEFIKNLVDILCGSFLMIVVLFILSLFVPLVSTSRLYSLFIIVFYALIGALVYFIFAFRNGTLKNVFGDKINKYVKKIKG